MKTASHLLYTGPGRVIISRGNPRGAPGGYRKFMPLAPSADIFRMTDQAAYKVKFMAQLAELDPQETWDKMHELAAGAEPVLCCFEKPPFTSTNWCHRRMVADWFEDKLGEQVLEMGDNQPNLL